jgi:hypothetical protein
MTARAGSSRWFCLAVLVPLVAAGGCGYSTEPLHTQTVRTIYVDMAQSREFRRGIEFELTEALRKQIDLETPYRNAPRENADTLLTAEVLEWRQSTLGRSPFTNLPRETSGSLIIRYRWQDLRTGKLLRDRPRFLTTVTYRPPTGETISNARMEAVNQLARNIVNDMQVSW